MPHALRESGWRRWIPVARGEPLALCAACPPLPGLWDLAGEPEIVSHWTGILRANARYLLELLQADGTPDERVRGTRAVGILEQLLAALDAGEAVEEVRTVHAITLVREHLLRAHGLPDVYRATKAREASRLLPACREALRRAWRGGAATGVDEALVGVLADLLAGNLFDLGSRSTQEAFRRGALDVPGARRRFAPHAAAWLAGEGRGAHGLLNGRPRPLDQPAEGRVLIFADNAGVDFLLGVLPAALFWARRWEVCLVVNSEAASSDITQAEARAHLALLAALSDSPLAAAQAAGRLRLVASGTGSPGIDFRYVGSELNAAADRVAWVLLEGQGRAVETNWRTRFRCPVLRCAVVKDPAVGAAVGVDAGTPLLRWDPPSAT